MSGADHGFTIGEGRTGFLLVHGLGGTPLELKFVAKGLARRGFTVHCCQLAGHCGDEGDLLATSWQDWYASVEAGLDVLRKRCDAIVAGGLSMGAVLALHLAAQRREHVQGLALYAPTLWHDGWAMPWSVHLLRFGILSAIGHRLIGPLYRYTEKEPYGIKDPTIRAVVLAAMTSGDTTRAGILVTPGAAIRQHCDLVDVVKRELRSIKTPAILIQARDDDMASLKNSEYLQRHLSGPVSTLILDDSYHIITVDRQRDIVIDGSALFATALVARLAKQAQDIIRPLRQPDDAASAVPAGALPADLQA
jgi:carboxylesterase